MNTRALPDEIAGFFDDFVEAFGTFNGRQSYNLVRVEGGWQILASTYHVG